MVKHVKKILFISLSNIGDAIMTLPALDYLKSKFGHAEITVVSGQRAKDIFEQDASLHRVIIFDKKAPLKKQFLHMRELRAQHFDMIVDFRDSFLGAILPARHKIPLFRRIPSQFRHMQQKHLYLTRSACGLLEDLGTEKIKKYSFSCKSGDEEYIEKLLHENQVSAKDNIIVISAGARSHTKRWKEENFIKLIPRLAVEMKAKIILVGDHNDEKITKFIEENVSGAAINLAGKTTLHQLACLLKKAKLLITNDSAVLHLASYLDVPTVAIFGPTNDKHYGPWALFGKVVKKEISCRPCEQAQCRFGSLACLNSVRVEDVLSAAKDILSITRGLLPEACLPAGRGTVPEFKRILIVRTDRIGDVLLSTPVISALRKSYPQAYITMMVSAYAREIVEGNPNLNEVIVYDKDGANRSWWQPLIFAKKMRGKKFNLAIILHPTNRAHIITFLAGISRRVGYNRKLGFLLTDKIAHHKQKGEKHEIDYSFDLLKHLGIASADKSMFMPLNPDAESWAQALWKEYRFSSSDKVIAIHPGASCPSKIWPVERFAQVADALVRKYSCKIIIIAGPKDLDRAKIVEKAMQQPVLNLAGKTSLRQLASLLKRCQLFISNDSGPVHVAVAVGIPVVAIFGRAQAGLSPKRWGPVGEKHRVLHKSVGCIECLAHNCVKEFACLKAISVEDVLNAADEIFKS